MNYTELKDALKAYTENTSTEFDAQLPVFIKQAEQRIYNTVKFPAFRKTATLTTVIGDAFLACPTDFLAVFSMAAIKANGEYEYLLNKDVNFIRQAYPSPATAGIPRYYALYGPLVANADELRFLFGPTPDSTYSVDLQYFHYPESITAAADGRTWLGDNFDTVLFYGSLIEAYTYMKGEPDIMGFYDAKYKEALAMARQLGEGMDRMDAYRSGQPRVPVT